MLSLLLACAVPAVDTPASSAPDLPTSTCGGPAYEWLPVDEMGEVLDAEAAPEWSLSADALRGLAGLAGVEDTSRITAGARTWRVRYRTQDRGVAVEATAIVAMPDPAPASPTSLVYLHPSTGFHDFCAPSGRDITWAGVPIALAGMGYAVVAPDYLGQNGFGAPATVPHPYLIAESTAVASLDALRALWAFDETGVTPTRATVLIGASQGGVGALWTERYASAYLPEAELLGLVASVPPLDLTRLARAGAAELTVGSVGTPLFLASSLAWYQRDADLGEVVAADQLDVLADAMANECPEATLPAGVSTVEDVYTAEWLAAVADGSFEASDPWGCFLAENSVGTAAVGPGATPALVIFGGADDISLGDAQMEALDDLCDGGAPIEAIACEGLGHTDTVVATFDVQLGWLAARVAGDAMAAGCGEIDTRVCGG